VADRVAVIVIAVVGAAALFGWRVDPYARLVLTVTIL
jgi:hypothetical protein